MIEVTREQFLPAPPERVWVVVESAPRMPEWFSGIETAEVIHGSGLGRQQRMGGKWGKHTFTIDQTVILYKPPRRLAWRHDRELVDGQPAGQMSVRTESHLELAPTPNGGTRVRLISRQWPGNFLKKFILRQIGTRRIGGMMDNSLHRLTALV
ncbi:MAG TPA: SRPBCC family protein [Opitutales bacterium]|nr:SRPBCC family protein [Opitutales bacterium]